MSFTTGDLRYYKRDFWSVEHQKFAVPHHRLQKVAGLVNKIAGAREASLLDVGCGPGTLARLLRPNVAYHGIDIAISDPAPNLREADILEEPVGFAGRRFDIVVAQGLFEYLGDRQSAKFSEIAGILSPEGTFIVSYVNFGHRDREVYWPYSNVQPLQRFEDSLLRDFVVARKLPTSHNWRHSEPNRRLVRAANRYFNASVPWVSSRLAVEYIFICSPRHPVGG
ncbi:MAG TPA: methyltransferase domain-containing protein [Acidimicrobiales bacterium]|jgi:predicted TPR repeat methyltransferase